MYSDKVAKKPNRNRSTSVDRRHQGKVAPPLPPPPNGNPDRFNLRYTECGRPGHKSTECWKIIGRPKILKIQRN